VSETRYIGLNSGSADEPPIWGIIFQLNRDDGIGTAIGVTVRCDDEADAREQARFPSCKGSCPKHPRPPMH